MEGWIKLHRRLLENPIVCKDAEHIAVWTYLLLNATHKEYPVLFAGKKTILQPGQLIVGRKSISEKLKVNESKVQRILNSFKNEQQIEQQTSNKNRLVSILNWNEYQQCEQQNEQQVNNNRTTDEQQVNTNKNVKNVENEKKERYAENITMTKTEYENLLERMNETERDDFIDRLNLYKGSKGVKYKSDYMTILSWHRKDQKLKPKQRKPTSREKEIALNRWINAGGDPNEFRYAGI